MLLTSVDVLGPPTCPTGGVGTSDKGANIKERGGYNLVNNNRSVVTLDTQAEESDSLYVHSLSVGSDTVATALLWVKNKMRIYQSWCKKVQKIEKKQSGMDEWMAAGLSLVHVDDK